MERSFSLGKVELVASTEEAAAAAEPTSETPFRILVVGDFRGRSFRAPIDPGAGLTGRKAVRIDRDDVDKVLAGFGAELRLPVEGDAGAAIVMRFRELDDFRPERIYEQVDAFGPLKALRRKLSDPSTSAETLRQLAAGTEPSTSEPAPEPPVRPEDPPPEDLLGQILEASRGRPARPDSGESGPFADFLARITESSRADAADPRLAEMLAGIEEATAELMRDILHHPAFRALEATWRSLDLLVRRLDTDELLTISLIDATRAELEADLAEAGDPQASRLRRLLVESAGGEPWAVIVGDLTFDATPADIALLGHLATVAQQVGSPFLAAARPRFVGRDSLPADPDDWAEGIADPAARGAWNELRRRREAAYVGLALPGFLVRLPYGRETDPVESFAFEELGPNAGAGGLLWGNPAYLLAVFLGQAFSRSGWRLRAGEVRELEGMPLHVAGAGEDAVVVPCTGVALSDRAAETLLDHGLMPMLSPRDRDVVRVGRFQSVAEPAMPLAGRWGG